MDHDASVQEDGTFDPLVGAVVTSAGKARWRDRLKDARAGRDNDGLAALREQLRRGEVPA
ncbi:hypothetical protein GCM10010172_07080 [Paractinoplanes ferrugineus]|uniref:Uncharacterized protein n=1 Tax=Paractinoplanes ferrugineus TaxID=113564 RepID=A0A919MIQ1_9ACTN|nr:hypothetical protein [Actinoplanes ferrugineus]GIE16264.1 hypothetical protein Afe05nite_81040 [Actinoplanes ferrugineus]